MRYYPSKSRPFAAQRFKLTIRLIIWLFIVARKATNSHFKMCAHFHSVYERFLHHQHIRRKSICVNYDFTAPGRLPARHQNKTLHFLDMITILRGHCSHQYKKSSSSSISLLVISHFNPFRLRWVEISPPHAVFFPISPLPSTKDSSNLSNRLTNTSLVNVHLCNVQSYSRIGSYGVISTIMSQEL